jgi:PAS domain S-box-containing protein
MGRRTLRKKPRRAPAGATVRRKLLVAESELDRFFRLSLDLLCIAGFDGYFKRVNPAWERLLGYSTAELLSQPYLNFVHPEDRRRTQAEADKLAAGSNGVTFENRYCARDGTCRWLLWNSASAPAERLIYATARDITERKQWEQRLGVEYAIARILGEAATPDEAVRQILQAICENLGWEHGAVWKVDREAQVLRCAEVWHVAGVRFAEFEKLSRRIPFPPGMSLPGRVWASGEPAWIPDVTKDTNFPRAPVAAKEGLHAGVGFPIRLENEVIGMMEFFSREMRKPDEDLLRRMASIGSQIGQLIERQRFDEAMQLYAQDMADLYHNAPCGYHSLNAEGVFVRVNDTELRWLGYARGELVGKKKITDLLTAEGRRVFAENFPLLRERGWVRDLEFEVVRKDGSRFPVLLNATAIKDSEGRFVMSRSTLFDMTERRALELMKDELIAIVGHELRTPLTSLRGALEMLGGNALPADGERLLAVALRNTDRLLRLTNDILDLERLQAGRLVLRRQRCDAAALVAQAVEGMRPAAEIAGVALEVAATPLALEADPDRILQTLTNLLGNAIKFSPHGARVEVGVVGDGLRARFHVRDRGRGIPPEELEAIFDRFHQLEAAEWRERGGVGLGLPISRGIVEQHGGRLWAESQVGEGSTFYFTLPLASPLAGEG